MKITDYTVIYPSDIPLLNIELKNLNKEINSFTNTLANEGSSEEIIWKLQKAHKKYSDILKTFNNQHFINKNEGYNTRNNYTAAKINDENKKLCIESIKHCFEFLDTKSDITNWEEISLLLWNIKETVKNTIPFKIYAYQNLHHESKWQFIGFAEDIEEAYHYIENDTTSWNKFNKTFQHMFMIPDGEMTQNYFKIESENFIEYFDGDSEGPLLKTFKYNKGKGICTFCGKNFDGYGKTCYPIQSRNAIDFGFNRCCPECENLYLKPAEKDCNLKKKLERQFLLARP